MKTTIAVTTAINITSNASVRKNAAGVKRELSTSSTQLIEGRRAGDI